MAEISNTLTMIRNYILEAKFNVQYFGTKVQKSGNHNSTSGKISTMNL